MIDTLSTFAEQVTGVARDVGVEGRLGGQADVPGAAGVWRDLTNNVNELAGNLTDQVRAIRDVATAVTQGRPDAVDHRRGARRDRAAQGHRQPDDPHAGGDHEGQPGAGLAEDERRAVHAHAAGPARSAHGRAPDPERARAARERAPRRVLHDRDRRRRPGAAAVRVVRVPGAQDVANVWRFGQGLVGQAALEGKRIVLSKVPPDYIQITSALGEAPPHAIVVVPILFEGEVKGVIELASFERFSRHPARVPRPDARVARHRDRDDRGDDAHRRAAAPVADPHRGAAQPAGRAAADQRGARGEGATSSPSRRRRSSARTSRSSSRARSSRRRRSSSR